MQEPIRRSIAFDIFSICAHPGTLSLVRTLEGVDHARQPHNRDHCPETLRMPLLFAPGGQ